MGQPKLIGVREVRSLLQARPVDVPISCAGLSPVSMELTLPPGETDLKFHSDAKVYELARPLCYSIRNYRIERVE